MLEVTDAAASALREARDAQDVPDHYGVRVFAQSDESGQPVLAMAFAEQPDESDQVTERDGTEVYVAPEVAEPLADSALHVEDAGDGPQLTLVPKDEVAE